MFCVHCGFKIEAGFNFCPNCGTKALFVQSEPEHLGVAPEQNLVDRYEYCPNNAPQQKSQNCGVPVFAKSVELDKEESLEDKIMSILNQYPPKSPEALNEIADLTGVGKVKLAFVIALVEDGKKLSELKDYKSIVKTYERKQVAENLNLNLGESITSSFNNVLEKQKIKRENRNVPHCPRCKSTAISYGKKPSLIGALFGYSVAGDTGAVIGSMTGKKGYAVCLKCGKTWKI